MKNALLLLNVVLAIAVAVLFYLHFSKNGNPTAKSAGIALKDSASPKELKIAYVDLDSIQEHYSYFREKMDDFERKKGNADRDLNNAFQRIENERVAFVQKGNAITQVEAEAFQREYTRKMQNLENQKKTLENNIQQEGVKTMEELKKKINEFLTEYNKTKGYSYIFSFSSTINVLFYKDTAYDITNEVLAGLNEAYNKTKDKK
jgi:outer membrane protein